MIQKTTNGDTIIDAIHRTRQRMAEKFGGDIAAILEDAWKRQEASGRAIWTNKGPSSGPSSLGEGESIEQQRLAFLQAASVVSDSDAHTNKSPDRGEPTPADGL